MKRKRRIRFESLTDARPAEATRFVDALVELVGAQVLDAESPVLLKLASNTGELTVCAGAPGIVVERDTPDQTVVVGLLRVGDRLLPAYYRRQPSFGDPQVRLYADQPSDMRCRLEEDQPSFARHLDDMAGQLAAWSNARRCAPTEPVDVDLLRGWRIWSDSGCYAATLPGL